MRLRVRRVGMQQKLGKWSLRFTEAPFILESSSVVGTKEADGPLGGLFDIVGKDDRFGQNTWEKAESSMQRDALTMALGKAHLDASDMDYVFACRVGSPPEKVIPPFFPKNAFWLIAICRISSGVVGVPPFTSIVSGLAQYRQRNGHPCRKTTSRRPGPSNVPILS